MCGISTIISRDKKADRQQLVSFIQEANQALYHRGPDQQSKYFFENIGLGHTRLSIVGTQNGDQPLFNEDRSIVAICNGEIYNYQALKAELQRRGHVFRTGSDNEVIIHLYETFPDRFVNMLEGMFSFVLLDIRQRVIHVARDRVGIKPLFLYVSPEYLVFGSEIKAILPCPGVPRRLDAAAIFDLFTFGYNIGESTAFQGIESMPPATHLIYDIDTDQLSKHTFWEPRFLEETTASFDEKATDYHDLFQDILGTHLIGDVPMSAYMSGGIDSTAAAVMAHRLTGEGVTTFSMSFENPDYDESAFFGEVVVANQLKNHILPVHDWQVSQLEKVIYHLEQPQIVTLDMANYQLSQFVRQHGFKMALAGDGADELLGGYDHFGINLFKHTRGRQPFCHDAFASALGRYGFFPDYVHHYRTCAEDHDQVCEQFGAFLPWYPIWRYSDKIKQPLFRDTFPSSLGADAKITSICNPIRSRLAHLKPFNKWLYVEMKTRLPNWILWKSDRNAMANSIEVRVPFLDNRSMNFLTALPCDMKTLLFNEKVILKKAFASVLPRSIIQRSKFAFNTPRGWLFGGGNPEVDALLSPASILRAGVFEPKAVTELFNKVKQQTLAAERTMEANIMSEILTGVLTTQLLHRTFFEREGEATLIPARAHRQV